MAILTPETEENQSVESTQKTTFYRNWIDMSSTKYAHLKKLAAKELGRSEKTIHLLVTTADVENDLTQTQYAVLKVLFQIASQIHTMDFVAFQSFDDIKAYYEKGI